MLIRREGVADAGDVGRRHVAGRQLNRELDGEGGAEVDAGGIGANVVVDAVEACSGLRQAVAQDAVGGCQKRALVVRRAVGEVVMHQGLCSAGAAAGVIGHLQGRADFVVDAELVKRALERENRMADRDARCGSAQVADRVDAAFAR